MDTQKFITLPISVVSPTDVARLTRELENLDEFFRQASIRSGGASQSPPRYSRLLDEVVVTNSMDLLASSDRENLLAQFRSFGEHAPVIHMSFSVDPPGAYVQKIVSWLRTNISPQILVRVGLQPNIGAGCVVRTTNKSFDMSLREYFKSKREFFTQKLHEAVAPRPGEELATLHAPEMPKVEPVRNAPQQESAIEAPQATSDSDDEQVPRLVYEDAPTSSVEGESTNQEDTTQPMTNNSTGLSA